jgi:hypothetical protein
MAARQYDPSRRVFPRRLPSGRAGGRGSSRAGERLTAPLQEVALARVVGTGNRRLVRRRGFVVAAHAPEQIGANRVEHVIAIELGAVEAIDERQCRMRSLDFGYHNRTVERDDGAWCDRQELIVQPQDLSPVGGGVSKREAACAAVYLADV